LTNGPLRSRLVLRGARFTSALDLAEIDVALGQVVAVFVGRVQV
jgi:hypothetical protein